MSQRSNYRRLVDELGPLDAVREHLPEDVLQEYEHALDELESAVEEAHGMSTDLHSIADVAGRLDDLARALHTVR